MNKLGRIESVSSFVDWCKSYEFVLENDAYQGKTTNRKLIDLSESKDKRLWRLIERFVKKEEVKQVLLMKYYKNGKLGLHRDKGKHRMVWSLSSTDFNFIWNGDEYECNKGYIYNFDGKMIHGLKGTVSDRWCLCWWR
jgi:hypothetical protein